MTDEQKPPGPKPHGRFEKWLSLVLANANVKEAAERKTEQEGAPDVFGPAEPDEEPQA